MKQSEKLIIEEMVEKAARAAYERQYPGGHWGASCLADDFMDNARAALTAALPLVIEECAKVADPDAPKVEWSESPYLRGVYDAATDIASSIRSLLPHQGECQMRLHADLYAEMPPHRRAGENGSDEDDDSSGNITVARLPAAHGAPALDPDKLGEALSREAESLPRGFEFEGGHSGKPNALTPDDKLAEFGNAVCRAETIQLNLRGGAIIEPERDLAKIFPVAQFVDTDLAGSMLDGCVCLGHLSSPSLAGTIALST